MSRAAPKEVEPVEHGGLKYTAPHWIGGESQVGGMVEVLDEDGKRVKLVKVYTTEYSPEMEADTQYVFITKLEVKDGKLHVYDEQGGEHEVDLIEK